MHKIGLYFGSFNPVHIGHLMIANYATEHFGLNEVHFVISPQNPFKEQKDLLDVNDRIELLEKALEHDGDGKIFYNPIELTLPQPSYTTNTLRKIKENDRIELENNGLLNDFKIEYSIIMGLDNFLTIDSWNDAEYILSHNIIVFPRIDKDGGNINELFDNQLNNLKEKFNIDLNVQYAINAPINNLSSTFIREEIKNNRSIRYYVTDNVLKLIKERNYYAKESSFNH
ncbi:MAG: nicotinate (nicotinamide) nucleotide adenylyltransferase [Bacilli bacterium]|nr:nicotinate (nicotinamide) nucleotide adenylyltransferase [Bacilli bacterium]